MEIRNRYGFDIDESELRGRLKPVKRVYNLRGGHGTIEIGEALLQDTIHYAPSFLHCHQGWFQDTLPRAAHEISEIAILRLDEDLYASTKVCLNHLFDKVVKGGFIITDDYGVTKDARKRWMNSDKRRE